MNNNTEKNTVKRSFVFDKLWKRIVFSILIPLLILVAVSSFFLFAYYYRYGKTVVDEAYLRIQTALNLNLENYERRLIEISNDRKLAEFLSDDAQSAYDGSFEFMNAFRQYVDEKLNGIVNYSTLKISSLNVVYNSDEVREDLPVYEGKTFYDSSTQILPDEYFVFKYEQFGGNSKWVTSAKAGEKSFFYLVKCRSYGVYNSTLVFEISESDLLAYASGLIGGEIAIVSPFTQETKSASYLCNFDYGRLDYPLTLKFVGSPGYTVLALSVAIAIIIAAIGGLLMYLSLKKDLKSVFLGIEEMAITTAELIKSDFSTGEMDDYQILEMHDIRNNFELIINNTKQLVAKKTQTEIMQKKSQLTSLEKQLNPHFVYNMIEIFRMKTLAAGQDDIADAMFDFGKMLRYNLSKGFKSATLLEEIEYVRRYVNLCSFKYDNGIKLICETDPDVENFTVCRFLLQPLVENSIKYNEPLSDEFFIKITAAKIDCGLEVSVYDNGKGVTPERAAALREKLSLFQISDDGIGLININARLHLMFGEGYGVTFESEEGKNFKVRLVMGIINEQKD